MRNTSAYSLPLQSTPFFLSFTHSTWSNRSSSTFREQKRFLLKGPRVAALRRRMTTRDNKRANNTAVYHSFDTRMGSFPSVLTFLARCDVAWNQNVLTTSDRSYRRNCGAVQNKWRDDWRWISFCLLYSYHFEWSIAQSYFLSHFDISLLFSFVRQSWFFTRSFFESTWPYTSRNVCYVCRPMGHVYHRRERVNNNNSNKKKKKKWTRRMTRNWKLYCDVHQFNRGEEAGSSSSSALNSA